MAGSATDYLEGGLLAHSLGITAFPMPGAIFVALCQTAPTDAAPGAAPADPGYTRMAAPFIMGSGQPATASNNTVVQFPPATVDWPSPVGWFELWDAVNGGNRLYWGEIVDPADPTVPIQRQVFYGDIVRVPLGTLIVSAD